MSVKYIKKGTVTHGCYCGGEWEESESHIEAWADELKDLPAEVKRLTEEHSSEGTTIDFGYRSGTKVVEWDPHTYKIEEVVEIVPNDVFDAHGRQIYPGDIVMQFDRKVLYGVIVKVYVDVDGTDMIVVELERGTSRQQWSSAFASQELYYVDTTHLTDDKWNRILELQHRFGEGKLK